LVFQQVVEKADAGPITTIDHCEVQAHRSCRG